MDALTTDELQMAASAPKRRRRSLLVASVLLLAVAAVGVAACAAAQRRAAPTLRGDGATTTLLIDDFEDEPEGAAPTPPWLHETFRDVPATNYRVQHDAVGGYLRGDAVQGGSLLTRSLDVDPTEYRFLRFKWRVTTLPVGADVRHRGGDDCAVRVFVTFAYVPERASFGEKMARSFAGRELPGSALCYVWTEGVELGAVLPNAYDDHTQMLVLESGQESLGQWTNVERDVMADYKRAFGRAAPRITGVAIMVDADQTLSNASADVDDIELRRVK